MYVKYSYKNILILKYSWPKLFLIFFKKMNKPVILLCVSLAKSIFGGFYLRNLIPSLIRVSFDFSRRKWSPFQIHWISSLIYIQPFPDAVVWPEHFVVISLFHAWANALAIVFKTILHGKPFIKHFNWHAWNLY